MSLAYFTARLILPAWWRDIVTIALILAGKTDEAVSRLEKRIEYLKSQLEE
jgi:hypothetical protein